MNCNVPALWLEHKELLRHYIRKRVDDVNDVDDILHDVLLKVYSFCIKSSGVKNLRSWLLQITHNTIADYHKRNSRFESYTEAEWLEEAEKTAHHDAGLVIEPLINLLPPQYAQPLILSDISGMPQAQIAQQLGLSLPATKSRIQRARRLLREKIVECSHFELDSNGRFVSFEIKPGCSSLAGVRERLEKKSL